jgi:TolB-like protein
MAERLVGGSCCSVLQLTIEGLHGTNLISKRIMNDFQERNPMKYRVTLIVPALFIVLTFLFFLVPGSAAKDPKKVAILPFNMNSERDLTFLQEGIMDMLISRLAWKGEVELLEKGLVKKTVAQYDGPMDKAKAMEIGRALGADYVILGSLTVFGESVSIDAKILDVGKGEELITAFNQSKGMDEVIPTVNKFAEDVNEKIMGRVVRSPAPTAAAPEVAAGPAGLRRPGESYVGTKVGYVRRFRAEIVSIGVGDVTGDGKNELVWVDKKEVHVYKWEKETFVPVTEYKGDYSDEFVWVSLMDADNNGRAEIFVSSLGNANVSSLVLEWQGNALKKIADRQPWFFRAVDIPGKGLQLIGQGRTAGAFYRGPVYKLTRNGNDYVSTEELLLPGKGTNVFSFAPADLGKTSRITNTVVLNPDEKLEMYDAGRELAWRSDDFYGGTVTFMKTDDTSQVYRYFPSPIYITDVDGDGEPEVMVCKNRGRAGRVFRRFRWFSSGKVEFLVWDKATLSTKWESKKFGGPVVGYRVTDVDNDGSKELLVCSVLKEDHILGKPRSQITVYDLK